MSGNAQTRSPGPLWNYAIARNADPIESHAAADRMNKGDVLTKHEEYALAAIRRLQGLTAEEYEINECSWCVLEGRDYKEGKIRKRLAGLERKGKIVRVADGRAKRIYLAGRE